MSKLELKLIGLLKEQEGKQMPLPDLDKQLSDEARTDIVKTVRKSELLQTKLHEGDLYYEIVELQTGTKDE
jgi:hypothetical protein